MQENEKTEILAQPLPGVKNEQRIKEIEEAINRILKDNKIRSKLKNADTAYDVEPDKTLVAEGIVIGITIWFLEKIAGKVFDEYIWPKLKKEIDGLIRK